MVKNLPARQETLVWYLGWDDLLEKGMATHSGIVAWRILRIFLVGYSPWGRRVGHGEDADVQTGRFRRITVNREMGIYSKPVLFYIYPVDSGFHGSEKITACHCSSTSVKAPEKLALKRSSPWTSLVAQMVKSLPTMWETRVQSLDQENLLQKEMATHSSTLTWKIPWTEEPGRLQSMGLQRVRHNWVTSLFFLPFKTLSDKVWFCTLKEETRRKYSYKNSGIEGITMLKIWAIKTRVQERLWSPLLLKTKFTWGLFTRALCQFWVLGVVEIFERTLGRTEPSLKLWLAD